ncbi:AAA family ATPase [Ralstonia solanacearum]|uniref:AAA family ATPase n=1 Tax=Ralstonia solanacearum TaxID=305 RepID=UPI0009B843C1|nr:ATP-binding protein [Ralstonia solanacearum]
MNTAIEENAVPRRPALSIAIACTSGLKYKSIENLTWENVPPFAVVTGLNGSGKTQLLEVLAYKLTGTTPHGIDLNGLKLSIAGDSFGPESVAYLPSRWEFTPAAHVGIPQMQQARDQLWSEVYQHHHNPSDFRGATKRARIRKLVGEGANDQESFKKRLPDDYAFMLEDGDVVAGLAHVLVAYRLRVAEGLEQGQSRDEIRKLLGPAPWDVINEAFQAADFPYEVVSPVGTPIAGIYELKLQSKLTGDRIPPGDLSSGEKMLLVLVLWLYKSQHHGRFPKLLLLDEPDANLHPSMTRQFLNVVKEVLVAKYGVRVIMTTHSPSTVALAPEGSVFEMSRTSPRIQQSRSVAETVGLLTAGLVVVSPGSRFVLVEDELDVEFYETIRQLLSDFGPSRDPRAIKPAPSLIFVPASRGAKADKVGGGSSVVTGWVNKFDVPPLSEVIRGVIDRDNGNSPTPRIEVVGRHSIENYLLDPLVVFCLLSSAKRAPSVEGLNISTGDEHLIREQPEKILTAIVAAIVTEVQPHIRDLQHAETLTRTVKFTKGVEARYPAWMLDRRGHDLMPLFQKAFGGSGVITPPRLEQSLRRLRLIPVELADIFDRLQGAVAQNAEPVSEPPLIVAPTSPALGN